MPEEPVRSEQAKQGRWGSPVLLVLIAGLILVGIVWLGAEIFGEATDPEAPVAHGQTTPSQ